MPEVQAEREWVLPSQVREKWTLRAFGEVFDSVGFSTGRRGRGGFASSNGGSAG